MTSVFSWQNSISLCPASFCTSRPNFPVTSRCFLNSYFCIPVPSHKKDNLLGVLVLEGLVGLHRTIHFSFFSVIGWGIDLDYCDIKWFALETNSDYSVVFEIAPKNCILDFFVDYESDSLSSKGFNWNLLYRVK